MGDVRPEEIRPGTEKTLPAGKQTFFTQNGDSMPNSVLFQPVALGDLALRNRIVLAPLTRSRSGAARTPNRLMAEYYTQRSSAGLLISEATTISPEANGWNESPGIYSDEMVAGWKHTTNAVHEHGGVIFLQLWHMGRASHSSFHDGKPAVAPSAIQINDEHIHTLRVNDILLACHFSYFLAERSFLRILLLRNSFARR